MLDFNYLEGTILTRELAVYYCHSINMVLVVDLPSPTRDIRPQSLLDFGGPMHLAHYYLALARAGFVPT